MCHADYAAAFTSIALPIGRTFHPRLVLLSAGFDSADGDPLGARPLNLRLLWCVHSLLLPGIALQVIRDFPFCIASKVFSCTPSVLSLSEERAAECMCDGLVCVEASPALVDNRKAQDRPGLQSKHYPHALVVGTQSSAEGAEACLPSPNCCAARAGVTAHV